MRISDWSSDVCSSDLNGVRDVASRIRGSCIPCSMHQITGNGVAAIMIPVDCPREPGPLSLTHKRFKSGQFCMGTIEGGFLMDSITAEERGGRTESNVKLEASRRAGDTRDQECSAVGRAACRGRGGKKRRQ